jgi:hypothetical protein
MSAVWGKLFGNRPTPANDAQQLAEPLLPAEPAPDALLRFGPHARRGAEEPLLKRSTPAAQSSASPEFVQSSASSATEEPGLPHRAGPWRLAGWGALGVSAPTLVAVAIVMLSPALRPPLESADQVTHPRAPSAAPAIPAADMTPALPGEPRAPLQIGEAAAPVRPHFKEGMAVPPSAIAVSPAPPPATSPIPTLASEAQADAERFIAEVERKMDAPFAEVDRAEAQWYSTSPEQAIPVSPPAVAVSPAPPPATSPVPQLLAILDSLSHIAGSAGVSSPNGAAPDTMSAGEAAPPASSSPAMEATSATSDDACQHDEDRLAELQAKPSLDEAIRFEREARCPKVWPQLLAILKVISAPAHSDESSGVAASAPVADEPPHPTERTADALGANVASDEVCKRDEERLARFRRSPSSDEAARFAGELSCEKLRPQLLALTGDLASPSPPDYGGDSKDAGTEMKATNEAPPASEAAADTDRPVAAVERERDAAAVEMGRLQSHRDSTSPEQATPPASPPAVAVSPAPPPATSPVPPLASEAAADPDRPAAAVERERDAAVAEADRLQSHRDSTSPEQATPPASPPAVAVSPAPPPATSPVPPLASEAAADTDRPVAAVERERDAAAVEMSRLQSHRDSTSPEQATPPASPPAVAVSPAPPPATSPITTLASEAEADAERFMAEVERKMHALSAEVDRKMVALSAEMNALFAEVDRAEAQWYSNSPEQATPPASRPPAVAVAPAPPPATSPVAPLASEAAADADRPVAAVERKRDTAAVEVGRLEGHQDPTSPEQNKPPASPPPAVAPSPLAPPTTSPVAPLASEAAADADRRISALERERDALAAEVGRLERHRDSASPGQATSPASPPPAIPAERSDLEPSPASASLPDGMPARVLIRYPRNNADARRHAESLANALTRQGVEVADLRESAGEIRTELSFSYAPDEAIALRVGRLAGIVPVESLAPTPASAHASNGVSSDAQAAREDARPAPPVVHAGVADLASDETCRRDGDRLARLRASPSGGEAQRFGSELGCEALRPQLQRLMESLGLVATAPPWAANSTASSDSVLAQVCASDRAALDRLRKEPSAEAARLFWRDLKCARLRPQVHLLMDSLNATPRPLGSAAEPGEADSRRGVTIDLPTANGTDTVACRREKPELDRIRATLDFGEAKRFASAVTCDALKPQAARLLESLKE